MVGVSRLQQIRIKRNARTFQRATVTLDAQPCGFYAPRQGNVGNARMAVPDNLPHQIVLPLLVVGQYRRRTRRIETVDQHDRTGIRDFGQGDFLMVFGHIKDALGTVFHKGADKRLDLIGPVCRIGDHQRFTRRTHLLLDAFNQKHVGQTVHAERFAGARNRTGNQPDQPRTVGTHNPRGGRRDIAQCRNRCLYFFTRRVTYRRITVNYTADRFRGNAGAGGNIINGSHQTVLHTAVIFNIVTKHITTDIGVILYF